LQAARHARLRRRPVLINRLAMSAFTQTGQAELVRMILSEHIIAAAKDSSPGAQGRALRS
jgi:hypothetical protein